MLLSLSFPSSGLDKLSRASWGFWFGVASESLDLLLHRYQGVGWVLSPPVSHAFSTNLMDLHTIFKPSAAQSDHFRSDVSLPHLTYSCFKSASFNSFRNQQTNREMQLKPPENVVHQIVVLVETDVSNGEYVVSIAPKYTTGNARRPWFKEYGYFIDIKARLGLDK